MAARLPRDEFWMARALELARRGEGLTRPNPPVGAVVVRRGRRVGEGYHRKAGGPHAEVVALRRAGARARGATLYVTLEPCCTWGRTPPCTDAILAAGIRRVVVSVRDPNPRHAGRGLLLLRQAGLQVVDGVRADEGRELLAPFAKWITTGRPMVTLKLGMSVDGRIGDAAGRSRWITGASARRAVHDLRRRVDAILVGRKTAELDDPSLLPVPTLGRRPLRVVLDARGRLPLRRRLFTDGLPGQTLVLTTTASSSRYRAGLLKRGVAVAVVRARAGEVPPDRLLRELGRRGILHVLCEGGGTLAESLIRAGVVDQYWFFVAPVIVGGREAVPAVAGMGWTLARAPRLEFTGSMRIGQDVLLRAIPAED